MVLIVAATHDELELHELALTAAGLPVEGRLTTLPGAGGARPAAVLLDARLDEAGWGTLAGLRARYPGVPTVLLTADVRPDKANRARARRERLAAFVAKPCPPDALAFIIRRVLDGERGLEIVSPFSSDWG